MNKTQKKINNLEELNRIKKVMVGLQESNKDLFLLIRKTNLDVELLNMNYKRQQQRLLQERQQYNQEVTKNEIEIQHLKTKLDEIKKKEGVED